MLVGNASLEEPFDGQGDDVLRFLLQTARIAEDDSRFDNRTVYLKITPENERFYNLAVKTLKIIPERRVCAYTVPRQAKSKKADRFSSPFRILCWNSLKPISAKAARR